MLIWLLALALAQDPPAPEGDGVDAVIVVYGDEALQEARQAVARSLAPLGWELVSEGPDLVFAPPEGRRWLGRAVLREDGRLHFRQPVAVPSLKLAGIDLFDRRPNLSGNYGNPDACGVMGEGIRSNVRFPWAHDPPSAPLELSAVIRSSPVSPDVVWSEETLGVVFHGELVVELGRRDPIAVSNLDSNSWLELLYRGSVLRSGYVQEVINSVQTGVALGRCPPATVTEGFDPLRPERFQQPQLAGLSFVMPSKRKRDPHYREALDASLDEVRHYQAVIRETALQRTLAELPSKLDALWDAGLDLHGVRMIDNIHDRRQRVLDYWATRDDSPTGVRIAQAVEDWLAARVVPSDAPITADEYAQYEAQRSDGRTLPRNPT